MAIFQGLFDYAGPTVSTPFHAWYGVFLREPLRGSSGRWDRNTLGFNPEDWG